jgi:hypothetical protein
VLVPKLVNTLKTYNREQFVADLTAGLSSGGLHPGEISATTAIRGIDAS